MLIVYCEACGVRIPPADLSSGAALKDSEQRAFCSRCAQSRRPAPSSRSQPLVLPNLPPRKTPAGTRELRATGTFSRQPREPQRRAKKPWILIGAIGGSLVLLVLVIALRGGGEPVVTKKPDPPPPPAVATARAGPSPIEKKPVEHEVKAPEPAPVPKPATAAEEIDDIRENFARRKWADLKAQAERAGGARNMRKPLKDFYTTFRSTAAGKEAGEFLKQLTANDPPPPTPQSILAVFSRDFKPASPVPGWRYLWNPSAAMGDSTQYAPLVWNQGRSGFSADANVYPIDSPAGFVVMASSGGHPGRGSQQNTGFDHFAIAAYTLQPGQGGKLAVSGTLNRTDKANGGTVELRVYINDMQKSSQIVDSNDTEFSTPLGDLKDGETIYIGVGPDKNDACDSFILDFSIFKTP